MKKERATAGPDTQLARLIMQAAAEHLSAWLAEGGDRRAEWYRSPQIGGPVGERGLVLSLHERIGDRRYTCNHVWNQYLAENVVPASIVESDVRNMIRTLSRYSLQEQDTNPAENKATR